MRHIESQIQIACVRWFRYQYPQYSILLIAIPNGGARGKVEAAIMKAEGVTAGAADLALFVPSCGYHGLFIEMKTKTGRQQPTQKLWQADVESQGYKYCICRSLEDFIETISSYLDTN